MGMRKQKLVEVPMEIVDATAVPEDVRNGKVFYNNLGRQEGLVEFPLPFNTRNLFFKKGTYNTNDNWNFPSPVYINSMSTYMAIASQGRTDDGIQHNNNWIYLNVPAKDCEIKISYGNTVYNIVHIDDSNNYYAVCTLTGYNYNGTYYYFGVVVYVENGLLSAIGTAFMNRYYTYELPYDLNIDIKYRG